MSGCARPPLTLGELTLVDQWNVQERSVSLFLSKESSTLTYSISGEKPKLIDFYLYLNGLRTSAIVKLFHDVIAENLRTDINPSSFIPVFESQAYIKRGEECIPLDRRRAALFGQKNPEIEGIRSARWGIFNETDNTTTNIEIDMEGIERSVYECLINVLCRKQTVKLYEKDVKAVAELDADGRIRSIALETLKRTSLYNRRVPLDENHWAITLISALSGISSNEQGSGRDRDSGHAMIAYEGVEDGFPFLNYVHLTSEADGKAIVKTRKGLIVSSLQGPTWSRPRIAVENMLRPIQEAEQRGQRLPFLPGRQILSFLASDPIINGLVTLLPAFLSATPVGNVVNVVCFSVSCILEVGQRIAKHVADHRHDCLAWAREQLPRGGIHITVPQILFTPNGVVQYLNNHPETVQLDGPIQ